MTGTTVVTFPSTGSVYATVDVAHPAGLTASSDIEAFKMGESTADNSVDAHIMAPMRFTPEYLSGTSFRIHVVSDVPLRGDFKLRWVSKV